MGCVWGGGTARWGRPAHWAPAWLVSLLFVREFVVTAARSSYESRGQPLKSTYLARYKTWVQMCGIGLLTLTGNTISMDVFGPVADNAVIGRLQHGEGKITGSLVARGFKALDRALGLRALRTQEVSAGEKAEG